MHALAVLPEVVGTWPNFILFLAIRCSTLETFIHDTFWGYFVYAFFMSVQVVLGAESSGSGTVAHLAFKRLRVPNIVLSGEDVSFK